MRPAYVLYLVEKMRSGAAVLNSIKHLLSKEGCSTILMIEVAPEFIRYPLTFDCIVDVESISFEELIDVIQLEFVEMQQ